VAAGGGRGGFVAPVGAETPAGLARWPGGSVTERCRSEGRDLWKIHQDRLYRASAASLCCQLLDGFDSVKVIAPPLGVSAEYRSPSLTRPLQATPCAGSGGLVSVPLERDTSSMYSPVTIGRHCPVMPNVVAPFRSDSPNWGVSKFKSSGHSPVWPSRVVA
jgi:hypothetical protein